MVNAILGWNLPVLNFAFHLPRPWTDQFAHVNHWQNNPNFNMLLRLVQTKYFSKANCFRVYWMLITWSTHAKCLLSSFWFYPIANGFTDAPSIKPNHSTWNVTWVLIQILLSCVAFFSAVFRFSSFTCIPIQSFSGRFFFLHFSTLPRPDFPAAMEQKNITNLFCFERALYKVFIFLLLCFLSWRMQTLQTFIAPLQENAYLDI